MRDPLYGIVLKLDRAHQQLDSLNNDIRTFHESKPYLVHPKYNPQTRLLTLTAHIQKPLPKHWGIQVGEIVHNLRSALDHLVWELVIHHTGSPPTSNKTQFPIFETEKGYRDRSGPNIAGVSPEAATLIESLQPFATGKDGDPRASIQRQPLWLLHELSNFDKHRTLHLVDVAIAGVDLKFSGLLPGIECTFTARRPGPVKDGTVFLSVRFGGTAWPFSVPPDQVKMDGPIQTDILFDEGCAAVAEARVVPLLGSIGSTVYETIKRIAEPSLGVKIMAV
jgi:hypothetical protein